MWVEAKLMTRVVCEGPLPPPLTLQRWKWVQPLRILDLMRFIDHSDGCRWAFGSLIFKKTCTLMVCADPAHV